MTSADARELDIVLWGATGFTGRLVAEYLARRHGSEGLRWGLGGRSQPKLERVREALAAIDPACKDLPVLVGDSADRASLDAIARRTRVVCSTVGPFTLHGRELVAACVDAGTHYCDSTGEPQFVRAMIDAHHARARQAGVRVVPCCGFDSIPSDLGTLVVQERARTRGHACVEVRHAVSLHGAGISGGTAASMVQIMEEAAEDPAVVRLLADPFALDPGGAARDPDAGDQRGVRWDADLGRWTGPFVMAAINARVVRRTNAMLGYAWGEDFRYREAMAFGSDRRGMAMAAGVAGATALAFGAMVVPQLRELASRVLPAPGEGPSKAAREGNSFRSRFVGVVRGSNERVFGEVRGIGDPGYDETAKMLGESALCLALDRAKLGSVGGILTPASAMGMPLVERLRAQGMTFEAA